jgi:hypothetical protein
VLRREEEIFNSKISLMDIKQDLNLVWVIYLGPVGKWAVSWSWV